MVNAQDDPPRKEPALTTAEHRDHLIEEIGMHDLRVRLCRTNGPITDQRKEDMDRYRLMEQ